MDIWRTFNGQINLVARKEPFTFARARTLLQIVQLKPNNKYAKENCKKITL